MFDSFKPKWKHSDPQIRCETVKNDPSLDSKTLETIARSDTDGSVRLAAIKRLANQADKELLTRLLTRIVSSPIEAKRFLGFAIKVEDLHQYNSNTLALILWMILDNADEFKEKIADLTSIYNEPAAHLTPTIDMLLNVASRNNWADFKKIIAEFKHKHLDMRDPPTVKIVKVSFPGLLDTLTSKPPQSKFGYHLITLWFEDGTSIRHTRYFQNEILELPEGWKFKRLENVLVPWDQT
jgi:hypothetical protein